MNWCHHNESALLTFLFQNLFQKFVLARKNSLHTPYCVALAYRFIIFRSLKKRATVLFVLTERSQTARYFEKVTLLKKIMNQILPRNEKCCTGSQMKCMRSVIRCTTLVNSFVRTSDFWTESYFYFEFIKLFFPYTIKSQFRSNLLLLPQRKMRIVEGHLSRMGHVHVFTVTQRHLNFMKCLNTVLIKTTEPSTQEWLLQCGLS